LVFRPTKSAPDSGFFCCVRCSFLLDSEKRIFGLDGESALRNAEQFIRIIWRINEVTDEI